MGMAAPPKAGVASKADPLPSTTTAATNGADRGGEAELVAAGTKTMGRGAKAVTVAGAAVEEEVGGALAHSMAKGMDMASPPPIISRDPPESVRRMVDMEEEGVPM